MNRFRLITRAGPLAFVFLTLTTACDKRGGELKNNLAEAGYQLTADDWFRAVRSNESTVLKHFLSGGISIDTLDKAGDTALHAAAAAGAKESADFLLDRGLKTDIPGQNGRTPLMAAVVADQTTMVRWLLKQGADPRIKDKDGFDALMLAAHEGKKGPVTELSPVSRDQLDNALLLAAMEGRPEIIDVLTNYGASIHARMEDGRTPLMIAAENGHSGAVKMLLDIGSARLAADAEGNTAADLAKSAGHNEIADLIIREPAPEDWSLESGDQIAKTMDDFVNAAASTRTEDGSAAPPAQHSQNPAGSTPAAAPARPPVRPISNEVLSTSVAPAPKTAGGFPHPPLVMRHYREREIPARVKTVAGNTAVLSVRGKSTREIKVRAGDSIPGSNLTVVRVEHRMDSSKLNEGKPTDVSVVEVRDTRSGSTRKWIAGVSPTAHDPVALVEDAATGKRYTASPGQRFKSADGSEFIVTDVRPNQIVIENASTGTVQTIPLRGPRG